MYHYYQLGSQFLNCIKANKILLLALEKASKPTVNSELGYVPVLRESLGHWKGKHIGLWGSLLVLFSFTLLSLKIKHNLLIFYFM